MDMPFITHFTGKCSNGSWPVWERPHPASSLSTSHGVMEEQCVKILHFCDKHRSLEIAGTFRYRLFFFPFLVAAGQSAICSLSLWRGRVLNYATNSHNEIFRLGKLANDQYLLKSWKFSPRFCLFKLRSLCFYSEFTEQH